MDTVQRGGTVVTLKDGRTRRFRSQLERRQIVEETLQPGASVSQVARTYDVNANQVFKWRRQYRQGKLEGEQTGGTMLPVRVSDIIPTTRSAASHSSKARPKRLGIIDIDLGHARIRIEGAADPGCVRAALEGLIR